LAFARVSSEAIVSRMDRRAPRWYAFSGFFVVFKLFLLLWVPLFARLWRLMRTGLPFGGGRGLFRGSLWPGLLVVCLRGLLGRRGRRLRLGRLLLRLVLCRPVGVWFRWFEVASLVLPFLFFFGLGKLYLCGGCHCLGEFCRDQ